LLVLLAPGAGILDRSSALGAQSHGVTPDKHCQFTTDVGKLIVCTFRLTNSDSFGDTVTISSITDPPAIQDVVSAAAGDDPSGDLLSSPLVFSPSAADELPTCTGGSGAGTPASPYVGATACSLPGEHVVLFGVDASAGASIATTPIGRHRVTIADYGLSSDHVLQDHVTFHWRSPCESGTSCPAGQQSSQAHGSTNLANNEGATVEHAITFTNGCTSPTQVNQPYTCTYSIRNNLDEVGDTLAIDGLGDVVHTGAGDVGAGNMFSSLRFEIGPFLAGFSEPPTCNGIGAGTAADPFRNATSCRLPFGSGLHVQPHSFYPVHPADFNLVGHALTDDAKLTWRDTCDDPAGSGARCDSSPQFVDAASQAIVAPPSASIAIAPDATNEVGRPHTFTVTLLKVTDDSHGFVPANGEHVTVALIDANGANHGTPSGTCTNAGPNTDANGQCTITFASSEPGQVSARAAATLSMAGVGPFTVETDGSAGNSTEAVKTFVSADIQVTPSSATSALGRTQTLTAHVGVDAGDGSVTDAPDGTSIAFTIDSDSGKATSPAPCITSGGTGRCTVDLVSSATGTTVVSASATVPVDGVSLTRRTDGIGTDSGPATVHWVMPSLVVNKPGDYVDQDGCTPEDCTLREAIETANFITDAQVPTIRFDLPPDSTTIRPTSELPPVTRPTVIDATTQPGYAGTPLVSLVGTSAPGSGLSVTSGHSEIRGFRISDWSLAGVLLDEGDGNLVAGNDIGMDTPGFPGLAGNGTGVVVGPSSGGNTIGGTGAGDRNVISGNDTFGIDIQAGSSGNVIAGNLIGLAPDGEAGAGNADGGIRIAGSQNTVGGTSPGARNYVSGNGGEQGIRISGGGNVIKGNTIGLAATSDTSVPNYEGIHIEPIDPGDPPNVIGDTGSGGNVIAGNWWDGIRVDGSAGTVIAGNYIGTGSGGSGSIGNDGDGIELTDAPSTAVFGNTISGNDGCGVDAWQSIDDDTGRVEGPGIVVANNFIGFDSAGKDDVGNESDGICFGDVGASSIVGNTISGNTDDGIYVSQITSPSDDPAQRIVSVLIAGNFIGTDSEGRYAIENGSDGIELDDASEITVTGNTISGNAENGAYSNGIAAYNAFTGNRVGTNRSGQAALANGADGIYLSFASASTIGGTGPGAGNLVSGNVGNGITIEFGGRNVVAGNDIGTNAAGTARIPNGLGIGTYRSTDNTIGGNSPADANVISGNTGHGVLLAGSGIQVDPAGVTSTMATITARTTSCPVEIGTSDGPPLVRSAALAAAAAGSSLPAPTGLAVGDVSMTSLTLTWAAVAGADNYRVFRNGSNLDTVAVPRYTFTGLDCGTTYTLGVTAIAAVEYADRNVVAGNFIGTDRTGTLDLGNGNDGVHVDGSGRAVVRKNTIWHNGGAGVAVPRPALQPDITINSIDLNHGLGIDLGPVGVTANDAAEDDGFRNFPEIDDVVTRASGTTVSGSVTSAPPMAFRIEVFNVPSCDPSGHGEGATHVGSTSTRPDGSFSLEVRKLTSGFVTATAATGLGDTSELSKCFRVPVADLAVTKTASPTRATVGDQVEFELGVINHGPTAATGVALTDTLPAAVSHPSVQTTQGTCTTAVLCNLGTLGAGETATVTIFATLNAAGRVCNTAEVASRAVGSGLSIEPVFDPDTANNVSPPACVDVTSADLSITKTASAGSVDVGDELAYRLTVRNAGPTAADAVTVTDALPPSTTPVSVTPSQGTCTLGATVVCRLGAIADGGQATVDVVVEPTACGTITNTATVASPTHDPGAGNNTASAAVHVLCADLSLVKTASPATVTVGKELTYTLDVANAGPDPAVDVRVVDTLPDGVTFVSASSSQGSCAGENGVACDLGTLPSGAPPARITIVVRPTASGTITNTATVTAKTHDPARGNNEASVQTKVTSADVSLTKTVDPSAVNVGRTLTYALTVANAGPSEADDVQVVDVLPGSVQPVTIRSSQGSCTLGGTTVCDLGTLPAGSSARITIVVAATAAGTITNSATATSPTHDPNLRNNEAQADATVTSADLSLTKAAAPGVVNVGQELSYTLTAANAGPTAAADVLVVDPLPDAAMPVSATSSRGSCTLGRTVSCALGTLPAGDSATVTIVVRPTSGGELANTARVTSPTHDPSPGNDEATARSLVTSADLSVTKTVSPEETTVGGNVTYTIVVANAGPTRADAVRLVDPLPGSLQVVSAAASAGSCAAAATVVCELGTVAVGSKATVTIVARVSAPGTIPNSVSLSSSTYDADPGDNRASVTAAAAPSADIALTATATPASTNAHGRATFTLRVSNAGPTPARGVTVEDRLGGGATVVSVSTSRGACSRSAPVSCAVGALPVGGVATIAVVVEPSDAGTLTSEATVSGADDDPVPDNNDASASVRVTSVDLSVEASGSPATVTVGGRVTYRVTVRNNGPSDTRKARLVVAMPAGAELVSATPTKGACEGQRPVTCGLGSLAGDAERVVVLVARPRVAGTFVTEATASSAAEDENAGDNVAETRVTAEYRPTLSLEPGIGPPGSVAMASGRAFPPDTRVLIAWSRGIGAVLVRTTAAGTFRVPILIFGRDAPGPRRLVASAARPTRRATSFSPTDAGYTVTVPTVQAPYFVVRR